MKKETIKVGGMSCNHCVNAIEKALKSINVKATVDLKAELVEVEFDETKTTITTIKELISDSGYEV